MNMPNVRSALNIPENVKQWYTCDDEVNKNYKRVYLDMSKQYTSLLEKGVRFVSSSDDYQVGITKQTHPDYPERICNLLSSRSIIKLLRSTIKNRNGNCNWSGRYFL